MIHGRLVRLRANEKTDLPRYVKWLNDPDVRRYLMMYLPLSLEQEEKWFARLSDPSAEERVFAIESADGGKHLGGCGYHHIDWKNRSAETGLFIGEKEAWGRGYGTDVMATLVRFGFDELNLHRIWLRVHDENLRGVRSYEKCGFKHEGRMRQAEFKEGRYRDVLVMSILRPEWLAVHRAAEPRHAPEASV